MEKNTIPQAWQKLNKAGRKMILREYASRVVMLLILFLLSRNWEWIGAWILIFFAVLSIILVHLLVVKPNPDLYNERGAKHDDTKSFDKILLPLYSICGYAILIVAALDERFQWSDLSSVFILFGILFMILACIFTTAAMHANPFFSSTVRIQSERSQIVINQGPYAIVRHPGYLGGIFFYLGSGCLLGSLWALIPMFLTIAILCLRTKLEDDTLQSELEGYRDFTTTTRYRLFPGIW